MKATAELKMLPVSVLKPAAYNSRKKLKPGDKEYEKIKNSITEFGFADPLVVNADMTIIGGHQRLTVAMELGYTEVPCRKRRPFSSVIKDCCNAYKKAIETEFDRYNEMSRESRKCVEEKFDYRNWIDPLKNFIEDLFV